MPKDKEHEFGKFVYGVFGTLVIGFGIVLFRNSIDISSLLDNDHVNQVQWRRISENETEVWKLKVEQARQQGFRAGFREGSSLCKTRTGHQPGLYTDPVVSGRGSRGSAGASSR